jgi:hypothetical protein
LKAGDTRAHLDLVCSLLAKEDPRKLAVDLTVLMHAGILIGGAVVDKELRDYMVQTLAKVAAQYPVAGEHMMNWITDTLDGLGGEK